MSNKTYYFPALLLMIALGACEKYPCQRSIGLRMAFVSFTKAETDTIIVRRFIKGTNLGQLLDSAVVDTALIKFTNRGDTLFPSELNSQTLLNSLYDYQVRVPDGNRIFTITDITEEEKKGRAGFLSPTRDACYNPITAYTLNGARKTVIPNREVVYLDY
jgi:hypothetical protein